ncbi:MAG: phage terminase large subunit [Litoreibacter sp.]
MLNASQDISPTDFQRAVLSYRGACNIMNAGGRGSGKSVSLLLDCLSHCQDFEREARPLIFRESHAGLLELQSEMYELCVAAFGSANRNKSDGTIALPNGAIVQFTNIGDDTSYAKLQGRTFTGIFADECGNYSPQAFAFMNRARSNLRVPVGRRPHIHMTANPGGKCHSKIMKQFINKSAPWVPFEDEFGQMWVWTTSSYKDNPNIDQTAYKAQLTASTGGDKSLADAWLHGSWDTLGGGMFDQFSNEIHVINDPIPFHKARQRKIVAADWGSSAPATALLMSELIEPIRYITPLHPNGFTMPVGTVIVHDETDTAVGDDSLSVGNGASAQSFAEQMIEMMNRNGIKKPCQVVCDDAKGVQSDTVIQLLNKGGVPATKPFKKDRKGHWVLIRQLLSNSVSGDGPGIYFNVRAAHTITTLPEAPRGTLNPEDIDPRWQEDHWADALAYGCRHLKTQRAKHGRVIGDF